MNELDFDETLLSHSLTWLLTGLQSDARFGLVATLGDVDGVMYL